MDAPTCNICLISLSKQPETYGSNTKMYRGVAITKCNHSAHIQCIHTWLATKFINKRNCSMCRQPSTPLSCSFNYGYCDHIPEYFENDPLHICNPSSINYFKEFLQQKPSSAKKTFYSKEFGSNISLLMYAVLKGYIDVTQVLIRAGADVNQANPKYTTPLFQAVKLKDRTIGRELIHAGATFNSMAGLGIELLDTAFKNHHEYVIDGILSKQNLEIKYIMYEAIEYHCNYALNQLIKKGVDIDNLYGEKTFLHQAVRVGSQVMVLSLAQNMKNIDAVDENGHTALFLAVYSRQFSIIKTLINFTKSPNCLADALNFATQIGDEDTVKLLLEKTTEIQCPNLTLGKALFTAVCSGHENIVKILCVTGSQDDINYIDPTSGKAIISKAVIIGNQKILEILCNQSGINLNILDKDGDSPLAIATFNQRLSAVKITLKYGANPNLGRLKKNKSITPMFMACQNGNLDIVEVLESYGAKIDPNSETIPSPLYIAVQFGHDKIVDFLLKHGAKTDIRRVEGTTALILAARNGHTAVVKLLLDSGPDYNLQKAGGYTALHLASREGYTEVVKLLLEKGADPNIQNGSGYTALDCAISQDHQDVVNLLKAKSSYLKTYTKFSEIHKHKTTISRI